MEKKLSVNDLDVKGKRVLLRVDFNVPLSKEGTITDFKKIEESLPTIQLLLDRGAKIILLSHLGKPEGKKVDSLSLKILIEPLSRALGKQIQFLGDCVGEEVKTGINNLAGRDIALLENLRFHPEEENPSLNPKFTQSLASLGDLYVDDAFGSMHRAHASIVSICKYFPKTSAMGLLVEKELRYLLGALENPSLPFFAIVGGAKISSKLSLLSKLQEKVNALFIGGAMAFTFLKSQRFGIGSSFCEGDLLDEAKKILEKAKNRRCEIHLPLDLMIAKNPHSASIKKHVTIQEGVPDGWYGVDIGPLTIAHWQTLLKEGSTIFWNGPLGVFEIPPFAEGTFQIAKTLANLKSATTIIGGGDSAAAIAQLGIEDKFTYISTGGGASLELIEKQALPGVEALTTIK